MGVKIRVDGVNKGEKFYLLEWAFQANKMDFSEQNQNTIHIFSSKINQHAHRFQGFHFSSEVKLPNSGALDHNLWTIN